MDALWVFLTVAVACIGGWPVTAGILRLAQSTTVRAVDRAERGTDPASDPAADSTTDETPAASVQVPEETPHARLPDLSSTTGVLRGGLVIGILERAAVVLAILAGQPVAIAYVVAIKGLGRYPELKQAPEASERFIIGTLASMLWAAAVAAVAKVLLL